MAFACHCCWMSLVMLATQYSEQHHLMTDDGSVTYASEQMSEALPCPALPFCSANTAQQTQVKHCWLSIIPCNALHM